MIELVLENLDFEDSVTKAEESLAAYWAFRNTLLEEYGSEHFFDLDRVISAQAREQLDRLMNQYIEESKNRDLGAA